MWSDALGRALGQVVAEHRRGAALELAQTRAELAEARATIAELVTGFRELEARVREECAAAALAVVRAVLADMRPPKDGRDGVTLEQLEPLVQAVVRDVVEANPAPAGKDGAPGMLPIVEPWQDRVYYAGEVVTWRGCTWQARIDTGHEPPCEDDWLCIAESGRNGVDGRSPRLRGLWTADETYSELDVAMINGASFCAICDDPGPCPGDGWRLLAARGKAGKPGEPGKPGKLETGTVIAADVDAAGLLTLVNADGSVVTCDLYPLLDKVRRA